MICSVYWIKDSSCFDVYSHGYVGVSQNPIHRFKQHKKKNNNIPKDRALTLEILFTGSREDCFLEELKYRPTKSIGWNRAVGGSQGFKQGFSFTEESKQKLKNAWTPERRLAASILKTAMNKTFKGIKRPKQSIAQLGSKNAMYGKPRSDEVKKKISKANLGKEPPNKQELYCIFCRQRTGKHVLFNRHTACFKKYCNEIGV